MGLWSFRDRVLGLASAARRVLVDVAAVLAGARREEEPASQAPEASQASDAIDDDLRRELASLRRSSAELQLRRDESEARFVVTFEQAAVGIAQVAIDGRWIRVNRKLCAIVGYSEAELLACTFQDITHPDDLDADLELVARVLAGELETFSMHKRYLRKGGSTIWVNLTVSLARKPDGSPDYFISVIEDIQARKDSEERLDLWMKAFASAGFGLVISDARKGTVLAANPAFAARRGYSPEAMIGQPIQSMFPPELWPSVVPRVAAIDRQGHGTFESEHVTRDGTRFPVLVDLTSVRDERGELARRVAYVIDISELHQAEKALRASEERLRLFIEYAPVAIAMFDREMRYLAASRRWRSDYALGDGPLIGRSHYEVFPEIGEPWKEVHRRGLAGEVIGADEDRFERQDGTVHWLRWEVRPWRESSGAVGGILLFSEDISARKAAELARAASDQRFRDIAEASADWMWEIDAEGRYVFASESVKALLGYAPEEVIGKTPFELMPPDEAARVSAAFAPIVERRVPFRDLPNILIRADGSLRHVVTTGVPMFDRSGALAGYRGLDRDVTEQQLAEKALRKLSLAVEQSEAMVIITDLDERIEYVNEAFERMTGYRRSEAIGRTPALLRSGETNAAVYASFRETVRAGRVWRGELIDKRKDGSLFVCRATIGPLRSSDGTPSHYVSVQEDVTETSRMQAELALYQKDLEGQVVARTAQLAELQAELAQRARAAEAANEAKSVFLANMSHEIRTPMNAILGFAHLLRRSSLAREQVEWVDKLGTAAEHLLAIISDILDLSKIEAGKLVLERIDFSLLSVLEGVRSFLGEQAHAKGLAVIIETDLPGLWLRGDPTRLRQALLNYASNAVKFTERGSVRVGARLLRDEGTRLLLRFEVHDTGIGIATESIPRLFHAFEQVDATTTRKFGGTGLGLAITRQVAALMEGEVGVSSTPGVGSTFWFSAWLERGEAKDPPMRDMTVDAEAELRRRHAGARVLLAEDDPINQEVALALLADTGLHIDIASDGVEAVAMAPAGYALILMDMQMPRMGGLAATRAIRALPACRATPILAMTANAFDEDRRQCLEAGMNDFVSKPVDPEKLFQTLLAWLDRRTSGRA
jgi:two-component system sensor histidine kinase/response regulator